MTVKIFGHVVLKEQKAISYTVQRERQQKPFDGSNNKILSLEQEQKRCGGGSNLLNILVFLFMYNVTCCLLFTDHIHIELFPFVSCVFTSFLSPSATITQGQRAVVLPVNSYG